MTASITDFNHFAGLRASAENKDPAALREVANQFEALFLQTMLKSMREASLGDPIFGDSNQHELYQDMMDKQLALEMAGSGGIGLADVLVRQLGGEATAAEAAKVAPVASKSVGWSEPEAFARDIWPHAERVARKLDVEPEAIVAQAALETGWGAHVMPDRDGGNSYNLFGIKAGSSWRGQEVTKQTLEFADGMPQQVRARFRAYADVASSFDDYAALLAGNPRYRTVSGHGKDTAGFARALQDSGYATDPQYADKISRIVDSPMMRTVIRELKIPAARPIETALSVRAH